MNKRPRLWALPGRRGGPGWLHRQLARARRQNRANERMLAYSRDVLCAVDENGYFVSVSPACRDLLGYEPEQLTGRFSLDFMVSADREPSRDAVVKILRGETCGRSQFRNRYRHRDGREVTLVWTAQWSPRDRMLFCVGRDISAELAAEEVAQRTLAERQTRIFESMTDAFFTLDRQWRLTYLNSRSEALLRSTRESILGKTFRDAFPGHEDSVFEIRYREAFATGRSVSFEAYSGPLDEWFDVNAYPSEDGLAVYFRSISDRKQADARLQATLAELERSNRELEDFAFVASHDLQEPLRKIQTFSDRLSQRTGHLDADAQDYLERMRSAARRMQALIHDLLDYSRISSRSRAFVACDLNDMLDQVLRDLETTVTDAGASIHVGSLPPVTGDPSQLRQVLQNLLSNALKFCHRAPRIQVFAEAVGDQGWTLVVQDNGIGFDPEYRDRIFQPFQRLQSRNQYPGTGIGLAIVKKILDRHETAIAVDSEPGQGTCFRIRFPRAPADGPSGSHPHE